MSNENTSVVPTSETTKSSRKRRSRGTEKPFERNGEQVKGLTAVPEDFEFGAGWTLTRSQFAEPHLYYQFMADKQEWKASEHRRRAMLQCDKYDAKCTKRAQEYIATAKDAKANPENYGGAGLTKAALKDRMGVLEQKLVDMYVNGGMTQDEAVAKVQADLRGE